MKPDQHDQADARMTRLTFNPGSVRGHVFPLSFR